MESCSAGCVWPSRQHVEHTLKVKPSQVIAPSDEANGNTSRSVGIFVQDNLRFAAQWG